MIDFCLSANADTQPVPQKRPESADLRSLGRFGGEDLLSSSVLDGSGQADDSIYVTVLEQFGADKESGC